MLPPPPFCLFVATQACLRNHKVQALVRNPCTESACSSAEYMAYMFKYDTVHGPWDKPVQGSKDGFFVEGKQIHTFAER